MRRIVSGSLGAVLMALMAIPAPAWAASAAQPDDDSDEDLVIIDDAEMEGEAAPAATGAGTEAEGGDDPGLFGDSGADAATSGPTPEDPELGKQDKDSEARQIKAEMGLITVVQRQRMLKKKRFELQPQVGISINDPYVRHYTLGLDLNYWITNRLAIGVTGTGLLGARTARYDNIRSQLGLLLTANQTLWQASVNLLYNPFYGKISIFNRALLHWEGAVVVGGGALQTRIIPRFEALHEPFNTITGGGHFGVMGRFYGPKNDWISVNWGIRAWVYPDKLEPYARGPIPGTQISDLNSPEEAKLAAESTLGFNVQAYLGLSFYLPTSFEYTTPR